MIVDKSGALFENRRKEERRKSKTIVDIERRKENRRKDNKQEK